MITEAREEAPQRVWREGGVASLSAVQLFLWVQVAAVPFETIAVAL